MNVINPKKRNIQAYRLDDIPFAEQTDYIPILWRILFLNTNFIDFLNIQCSTTVKNRELGTIYLDKTVVNTHSIKCRHSMFDG